MTKIEYMLSNQDTYLIEIIYRFIGFINYAASIYILNKTTIV